MKKNRHIMLATIAVFLYWIIDTYHSLTVRKSTFTAELFNTQDADLFYRILICAIIFSCILLAHNKATKHIQTQYVNTCEDLAKMSDIIFSPLPLQSIIERTAEKLKTIFGLEGATLFFYEKDKIIIKNETLFSLENIGSQYVLPFKPSTSQNPLESIISRNYIEKREFSKDAYQNKESQEMFYAFSFALQEKKESPKIGSFFLVTKNSEIIEQNMGFINKTCELLTLVISLASKRERLLVINEGQIQESSGFDKTLLIINHSKLEEYINLYMKKHKRYHIETSMMLIEINLFKNLANIFPEDSIVGLQKEFIRLIKNIIRDTDIFAKYSSEGTFALLCDNVGFRGLQQLAKKLQDALDKTRFQKIGKITCSFGITSISPKDTIGSFRSRCESALHECSRKGGSGIEVKLLN
ncbi:MAG: diguanylate cyclase [Sulfurospirillaceae bacterium]|nr:diguanylate cyclase [Sulfurospirillaceae bacterium]